MCCEDLTIGRDSTSRMTKINVPLGTNKQIVSKATGRIGLWIIPDPIATTGVSMLPLTAASEGIQMFAGIQPLRLNIRDDGDAVQQSWFAFSAADVVITILEVFPGDTCDGRK